MRIVCVLLTKISLRFPSSSIFVSKVDTCDIVSVDSIENGLCTNDTEDALKRDLTTAIIIGCVASLSLTLLLSQIKRVA